MPRRRRFDDVLGLADRDILPAQLRLLLRNVASSFLPISLLSIVIYLALVDDDNAPALRAWAVASMSVDLGAFLFARHHLRHGVPAHRSDRLVWAAVVLYVLLGAVWGSLTWVAYDGATVSGKMIMLATVAASVGSVMTQTAIVLPVFIAYASISVGLLIVQMFTLDDPTLNAFAVAGVLYLGNVMVLARNHSQTGRKAIALRFENRELVDQIHVETQIAEAALQQAEQANLAKSRFLASASHALRQPLHARCAPMLVELVLRNLVSNAIRYTVSGGVQVAVGHARGRHVLEVWDTGIGIAPQDQASVFVEFHQLGNPERDRRKGLGLGLAIARRLAGMLQCRLWLRSEPWRGSVFRLELPAGDANIELPDAQKRRVDQRLHGMRVLVIDDDDDGRAGMLELLDAWGCDSIGAASTDDALTALGRDLPAVLISGDTTPAMLLAAKADGLPLLHKPVKPEQMQRTLVELLPG